MTAAKVFNFSGIQKAGICSNAVVISSQVYLLSNYSCSSTLSKCIKRELEICKICHIGKYST